MVETSVDATSPEETASTVNSLNTETALASATNSNSKHTAIVQVPFPSAHTPSQMLLLLVRSLLSPLSASVPLLSTSLTLNR